MILEILFDFGFWLFELIADAFPSTAPVFYNVAITLSDILGIGVWVIGEGMWTAIIGSVAGWLTFKLTWGIVLFVYKLIPLCG